MKTFTINSQQAFIKNFNGQRAYLDETKTATGTSGTTKLYGLEKQGAGLFLRDDEVVAQ